MSDIKARAKSILKLSNGQSNITWEFQKGQSLTAVCENIFRFTGVSIEQLEDIAEILQNHIDQEKALANESDKG